MKPCISFFFLLVLLIFPLSGYGQSTPQEEALQLYTEGKYSEALPIFKRLVTLFPKDPKYQYYSGVCMVQSNVELAKAVDYLKFASDKAVPREVYFFLGKAYHYLYRFNDAMDAYVKFQQYGERAEKEKLQCDLQLAMARNAKMLLEKLVVLDVHSVDSMDVNQIFNFYNKRLKNGQFKEKQVKVFPFSDPKASAVWRFVPSMLDKGDLIYEPTLNQRRNKDLAQVSKLDDDNWSRPENLGSTINSPYDEDYVYFNSSEPALYFASKGHNSMGGYDIFKSVFDVDKKIWSEPINMGFPINTPYDDYLFVPSEDQTKAFFVSNRDAQGDKVKVYTISFTKTRTLLDISADVNFLAKSKLAVNAQPVSKPQANQRKAPVKKEEAKPVVTPVLAKPVAVVPVSKPVPLKNKEPEPYPVELAEHKEYNSLLHNALHYQLMADSLSRVAENIRQQISSARNETEASSMKREIYLLDQKSKTTQLKADELYEKARAFEIEYTEKDKPKKTEISVNERAGSTKEKGSSQVGNTSGNQKKSQKKSILYEFRIMAKSPYSKTEDIPLNLPAREGLTYRIQMGAFSKPIEANRFKGLTPICGETLPNNITKFYAGVFGRAEDAEKALIKVREYGFKDAYVVSFFNGKTIPINRAKEIEKSGQ